MAETLACCYYLILWQGFIEDVNVIIRGAQSITHTHIYVHKGYYKEKTDGHSSVITTCFKSDHIL